MSILRGEDAANRTPAAETSTPRDAAPRASAEPQPPARSSTAGDSQPPRTPEGSGRDGQGDSAPPPRDPADTSAARTDPPEPGTVNEHGVRTFTSNESAEQYAQRHLGHMFPDLPPEQQRAVYEYTRHSWPYNGTIRADLPAAELARWQHHPYARELLTRSFDGRFPTLADVTTRIALIDQALNTHHLPEGIQAHRGLQEINFMRGNDGRLIDFPRSPGGGRWLNLDPWTELVHYDQKRRGQ